MGSGAFPVPACTRTAMTISLSYIGFSLNYHLKISFNTEVSKNCTQLSISKLTTETKLGKVP